MRAFLALAMTVAAATPAMADGTAQVVVPNRPDVPVIINGVDASWAVVEGDWGLARGVRVQPTVYGGRYVDPEPAVGHYFPSAGKTPGYGRVEIEAPRRRPPRQAESYTRSWSAQFAPPAAAAPPPAVIDAPYGAAPDMMDRPRRRPGY